jgi:tetratricopeptide (TPR) repeat protein
MANYEEALADYSASLRIDPRYANAYANRGLAYFRLNRKPQACQDFQKACDLGSCDTFKWSVSRKICE